MSTREADATPERDDPDGSFADLADRLSAEGKAPGRPQ